MIAPQSPIVVTGIRVVSPLAIMLAAYLFFAGHNQPGGGFAAGLVLGSVAALRMVAGLRQPADAIKVLAVGGVMCGLLALAPLVAGEVLLDQIVLETTLPLLGKVKGGSALVFDLGVTLIVVGLVLSVLEGLGAINRDGTIDTSEAPEAAR